MYRLGILNGRELCAHKTPTAFSRFTRSHEGCAGARDSTVEASEGVCPSRHRAIQLLIDGRRCFGRCTQGVREGNPSLTRSTPFVAPHGLPLPASFDRTGYRVCVETERVFVSTPCGDWMGSGGDSIC